MSEVPHVHGHDFNAARKKRLRTGRWGGACPSKQGAEQRGRCGERRRPVLTRTGAEARETLRPCVTFLAQRKCLQSRFAKDLTPPQIRQLVESAAIPCCTVWGRPQLDPQLDWMNTSLVPCASCFV